MGLFPKRHKVSSSSLPYTSLPAEVAVKKDPNPNPSNWKLLKVEEVNGFLIVHLNYPDCTNYEGNKILVFKNLTLVDLVNQRLIDPHFFKDSKYKSPIARFEPTAEGWAMAKVFVAAWHKGTKR